MFNFQLLRLVMHGTLLALSLIVLGLGAFLLTNRFTTPGFPVAVSVLTIVSILPIVVIDFIRKGSITSWVMVELSVCGFLTILWLAASGLLTDRLFLYIASSVVALKAFTWLAWLTITAYTGTLLALAVQQNSRGNTAIWKTSIADFNFFAPQTQIPGAPMQTYPHQQGQFQPQQFAPQQQQQHPAQQYGTPQPMAQQYTGQGFATPQHTGQGGYNVAHV